MFSQYLVMAGRNLARTPFHTAVSIVGLALGFACFVGAYMFVAYVRSADRQCLKSRRIA